MEKVFEPKTTLSQKGAAKESRRAFYQPELDILRFFAFLLVFLHHLRRTSGDGDESIAKVTAAVVTSHGRVGDLWNAFHSSLGSGVSLFFFLSAYLITTLLMMEIERTGKIDIAAFYVRRALRIWPLYFTYLLIVILLGTIFAAVDLHAGEMLSCAGFYSNWYRIRHGLTVPLLGALWSISIEEQFYLFCPISARVLGRKGLAALSVVAALLSCFILYWYGSHGQFDDRMMHTNTFVQMIFLVAGTMTALILHGREARVPSMLRPVMILGGLCAWGFAYLKFWNQSPMFVSSTFAPLLNYLLILLGVLLIFFGFLGLSRRWTLPSLVYLGKISYGLYIWHVLVLWVIGRVWLTHNKFGVLASSLVSLGLTILIAGVSYRWLEKPFLLMKERFATVKSRAA